MDIHLNTAVTGSLLDDEMGIDAGAACTFVRPVLEVPLDIVPGKCPNFIGDKGNFKVALPGDGVAATDVQAASLELAGVPPDSCGISDKATPYFSTGQGDCIPDTRDGVPDVVCNFNTANFLLLTGLQAGEIAELELTGNLANLTPISATDYAEFVERARAKAVAVAARKTAETVSMIMPTAWLIATTRFAPARVPLGPDSSGFRTVSSLLPQW